MKTMLLILWAAILGVVPARAVLGEREASVSSDQQVLRGEARTIAREGFSVQQVTAKDKTVVREYVSPAGLVFGVSWQASSMPNLQQLLGASFAKFQQASQSRTRRRGPLVLRTKQLVVESGGHPRSFHGRAYLPALFPDNISAEVVR